MKLSKLFLTIVFLLVLLPMVAADFYFGGRYYDLSPSRLLENEWVVFGGIALLIFSLVYVALLGTLGKSGAGEQKSKGAIIVISLVVAIFGASALTQQAFFYGYLGEEIVKWVVFGIFIAALVALIPFFKFVKDKTNMLSAILIVVLILWFFNRVFVAGGGILSEIFYDYGLSYIFEAFADLGLIFWIIVIVLIVSLFWSKKKKGLLEKALEGK